MLGKIAQLLRAWRNQEHAPTTVSAATPGQPLDSDVQSAAAYSAGTEAFAQGRFEEAVRHFEHAVECKYDHVAAYNAMGLAWQRLGRFEDATDAFLTATGLRPHEADAYFHLGTLYLQLRQFDGARRCLEQALERNPDHVPALNNLGYLLFREFDLIVDAERLIRRALDITPEALDARCNLGMVLQHAGRLDEALTQYEEVLRASPGFDEARLNRALIKLSFGQFASAWPDYEARKQGSTHFVKRPFVFPEWRDEALAQRGILVYAEQGLGDELMFASCIPDLLAGADRCVIECSAKLERLFRRSFPRAAVHGGSQTDVSREWLKDFPGIDMQVPIGSLPLRYRKGPQDFPLHTGYLKADSERTQYWRARLAELGPGLKIGISWRGGTRYTRGALRSLTLEDLLPLKSIPDAILVSLQYGDCRKELAAMERLHGRAVHHWQEAIEDYDETAALVSALDVVVSVCTAVVHLTGALGKPVCVMVPAVAEWRYQSDGAKMPWYPTARLFRQRNGESWQTVIAAVVEQLRTFAKCSTEWGSMTSGFYMRAGHVGAPKR
jgi:tetratricopeptide (TPR) repeat protein